MAVFGALGGITFSVSRSAIHTFDDLKWDSGVNYAQHAVHLGHPKLEFVGYNAATANFKMDFNAYYGVNPATEVEALYAAMMSKAPMRLVIGNRGIGGLWVISKLSKAMEKYDNKGKLLKASVNISLTAYA